MSAQSELRSPASSDSPILPAPRIAILMTQAYESGRVSRQQVHAREPGPLAVGLEQGVGLLGLDAPSPELRGELDEPEVAREPALVAAEALEADDAGRPRPEPALALEPLRHDLGREPFSASRSMPRQSRTSAAPRRAPSPRRRSSAGEKRPRSAAVGARVQAAELRGVAARMTARSISRASRAVISCPATARSSACATVAVRSGRSPRRCFVARPSSGSSANRRRNSEWSSSTAEHEPHALEALLARAPGRRRAVRPLPRPRLLEPAAAGDRRREHAVANDPRRVAPVPRREPKRVRPARPQHGRDHGATLASCRSLRPPAGSDAARPPEPARGTPAPTTA